MSKFLTPWTTACQASLSFAMYQSLLKLMSIELGMPSNHCILCCSLLQPSVFLSIFSNESSIWMSWSKYFSFNFSISPSNEYSGLISFRIEWLCLLTVPGTLKSLIQHHSQYISLIISHDITLVISFMFLVCEEKRKKYTMV